MCTTGTCIDMPDQMHTCVCPMNMTGPLCADPRVFNTGEQPRFDGKHSYVTIAAPTTVITDTKVCALST
jgi:hypothetical protein